MIAFNNIARIVALSVVLAGALGSAAPIDGPNDDDYGSGLGGPLAARTFGSVNHVVERAEQDKKTAEFFSLLDLGLTSRDEGYPEDLRAFHERAEEEAEFIGKLVGFAAKKVLPKVLKYAAKHAVKSIAKAAKPILADIASGAVEYVQLQRNPARELI
jgi:hypothetical protein